MTALQEINHILEQMPPYGGYVTLPRKFLLQVKAALSDVPVTTVDRQHNDLCDQIARHLTKTEYLLLRALVGASGRVISPGSLIVAANLSSSGSLWVHVKRLRFKLGNHAPQIHLETIRGRGYLVFMEEKSSEV